MGEEFEALLREMTDEQINALDVATLDDQARKSIAIEAGRRNRQNEMAEFDAAQERGATVSEGNRRWPILILAGIIVVIVIFGTVWMV